MMRRKDYCLYYDDDSEKCRNGNDCTGARCKAYVSFYTRTDCEHFDAKRGICRVLVGQQPPCSVPRFSKKTGNPIDCTFYEKK